MSSELTEKVSNLVDLLREKQTDELAMADVAMVTEVLISTMQRYFGSIDTQIYREFRELATYIEDAKSEISQLRPGDLKQEKLPRAGLELDAIVQATEEATNTIMEAAESLMDIDSDDPDEIKGVVMDKCMAIFEACSFQDITGQRISKVVTTLTHIEDRLSQLQHIWWSGEEGGADEPEKVGDAALLNGPQLAGEGIDQSYVDSVEFTQVDADQVEALSQASAAEAAAAAESAPEPEPEAAPAEDKKEKKEGGSQADIDALFD